MNYLCEVTLTDGQTIKIPHTQLVTVRRKNGIISQAISTVAANIPFHFRHERRMVDGARSENDVQRCARLTLAAKDRAAVEQPAQAPASPPINTTLSQSRTTVAKGSVTVSRTAEGYEILSCSDIAARYDAQQMFIGPSKFVRVCREACDTVEEFIDMLAGVGINVFVRG